jgi:hypothetical protein
MADWVDSLYKDLECVLVDDDDREWPVVGSVRPTFDTSLPMLHWRGHAHITGTCYPAEGTLVKYRLYCQGARVRENKLKLIEVGPHIHRLDVDYTIYFD